MSARRTRQRGFTLFEVMVAVAVSATVLAPAMALLFATMEWNDQAMSQIRLNQQARAVHSLLADGARFGTNGTDGTRSGYGLHGMTVAPSGTLRATYRLGFVSNGHTVMSDQFAPVSVRCTGAGTPIPDCASASQTKTMSGFLSQDVSMNVEDRSVDNRTAEVSFTLTDPFQAQRLENPAQATQTYRAIFTLLDQQHDDDDDGDDEDDD